MTPRTLLASVACAVVLCGAATACTSKDESPPTVLPSVTATASTTSSSPASTTTSPAPTSTSSAPTVKQTIIAQWQKYWNLMHSLQGKGPKVQTDALLMVASPQRAAKSAQFLQEQSGRKEKEFGAFNFGPTTVAIVGETATTTECRDESNLVVRNLDTNVIVLRGEVGTKLTAKFSLDQTGIWKLAAYDSGDC